MGSEKIEHRNGVDEQSQINGNSCIEESNISLSDGIDNLTNILEGETRSFSANVSLMEYFQNRLAEGRIRPDHHALYEGAEHTTFKDLDETSTKLATVIRNEFCGHDVLTSNQDNDYVIGVCMQSSRKLIFSVFAILKLGAAYLPFDTSFPENRIIRLVEEARPLMIISDDCSMSKFDPVIQNTRIVNVDELMSLQEMEDSNDGVTLFHSNSNPAEATSIVLYTSGSSGTPKGVRLSHRAVMNRLSWQWEVFPYITNERCCFKTAITFVDSVAEIFGPLLMGHSITVYSNLISSNPHNLIQKIADDKITRIVLVPSLLRAILQTIDVVGRGISRELLKTVSFWICSGETLQKHVLLQFFEIFPSGVLLANFYGSTEIMGDVTYETFLSLTEVEVKTIDVHVPIGHVIDNTVVYILDPQMKVVPEGEIGEMYIAGHNLASGYVGIPNSDKFVSNPHSKAIGFNRLFKTGDFARLRVPSSLTPTLFYEGRVDSQIKIRGSRVDLSEIEAVIRAQTELFETAVVLCYRSELHDQKVVAFVIPKHGVSNEQINEMLKLKFRPYEIPFLRIIVELPLLVNGKVDRQRLLRSLKDERISATPYMDWHLLDTSEEQLLKTKSVVEIVSDVTGVAQTEIMGSLDESFFNLGGTSLNSVTVIMKLYQRNLHIPVADFASAKSIKQIIGKLQLPPFNLHASTGSNGTSNVYLTETLKSEHMEEVVHIIAYSFSQKGNLATYTQTTYEDYLTYLRSIWCEMVQKEYSFVIRRQESHRIIGVSLNFSAYDYPEQYEASQGLQYEGQLIDFVEEKILENIPKGKNKLWYSFMLGTHEEVDPSENVYLTTFIEEENIRLAMKKQLIGIMTTNTNPLTQQICNEVLEYIVLTDYQINQFVSPDGTKPYALAPDSERAICCWKKINYDGDSSLCLPGTL